MTQRNTRKLLEVRDITLIVTVSQVYAVSKFIKLYTLKKKKNYSHGDLTWPFGSTWICEAHERKRMKERTVLVDQIKTQTGKSSQQLIHSKI